jgi:exopolysaccharide biosynthesis polyprenyl glycosylphosphotransferase
MGAFDIVTPRWHRVISHTPPWYRLALPFSERRVILLFGDLASLTLASMGAMWGQSLLAPHLLLDHEFVTRQLGWLLPLALIWAIVAVVNECYDFKISNHPARISQKILLTALITSVAYMVIYFVFDRPASHGNIATSQQVLDIDPHSLPRMVPVLFLFISSTLLVAWRVSYIRVFANPYMRRRAIIVGAGWAGETVSHAIQQTLYGYDIVGFIDDDPAKQGKRVQGFPMLGTRDDLKWQIERTNANEIILAITHEMHNDLTNILMDCHEQGIPIKPMPFFYEEVMGRIPVEHLGQKWVPFTFWNNTSTPTFYLLTKRITDIVLGLVGLIGLVLLFPIIALAIYLDSPGPIFYRQERSGKGGKTFNVFKFRSMIPNAETQGKAVWATKDDPRVTHVGKFLRRTRLDELPQVINVLFGDMSIVGPRPERPQFIEQLQESIPFYRARLSVKPGLTGWAQVKYRYGSSVEDALMKLQYDLYYIKHQSLLLDALVILRTVKVVLTFKGT